MMKMTDVVAVEGQWGACQIFSDLVGQNDIDIHDVRTHCKDFVHRIYACEFCKARKPASLERGVD